MNHRDLRIGYAHLVVALLLPLASSAASNPEGDVAQCEETETTYTEYECPRSDGIVSSGIDCSSVRFVLAAPKAGVRRETTTYSHAKKDPSSDGECIADSSTTVSTPIVPEVTWRMTLGTNVVSGSAFVAATNLPYEVCDASVEFLIRSEGCSDTFHRKALSFTPELSFAPQPGPRICLGPQCHTPHRFGFEANCEDIRLGVAKGPEPDFAEAAVEKDAEGPWLKGIRKGTGAVLAVTNKCLSVEHPFDVVGFDGFRFEAGCGCVVEGGRETMLPAETVRVTPKAYPESYDGECCWRETKVEDPAMPLLALEEELLKVHEEFAMIRSGSGSFPDPFPYSRVLIRGWFDCERNLEKDDGEPEGTDRITFADLGVVEASSDSGKGNRSSVSRSFTPGTVVEFANIGFRPTDRAHVLSVVETRAEKKPLDMSIPLGPLVPTGLNAWRLKIPDDCPDGIFRVELKDPLHSCHTLTNTFCVEACPCGSCEDFAKAVMENGCVKMSFGLGRLASGGREAPLSFVLEGTSHLPDLASLTVADGTVAVTKAGGRMTLAFTRTGGRAPLAVYELVPGASAFTVNETRNGSPRSSTVWRKDGETWTMETYDHTVSPRALVGRTVRTESVSGPVETVRLDEGGRVTETDYTDIPGVGRRVTRETRGTGPDAVTDRTSYVLSGPAAGKPASELLSDGSWSIYAYDPEGRVASVTSPFGDTPPVVGPGHEVTGYDGPVVRTVSSYGPVDGRDDLSLSETTPRTIVTSVGSDAGGWTEVSRTYRAEFIEGGRRVVISERAASPGAAYGAPGNLSTTTLYRWRDEHAGLPAERIAEDGLVTRHSYAFVADGGRITETFAAPVDAPGGIPFRTVVSRTVGNAKGDAVAEEEWLVTDADRVLLSRTEYELDAAGHVLRSVSSDGSVTERTWGCCGPESERDASGVLTERVYDASGRETLRVRDGITTETLYDLSGNATNTVRIGTAPGNPALTASASSGYDTAGRLAWRTGEDGVRTEYRYGVSPAGGAVRTVVTAAGTACAVTNETLRCRDGRVESTFLNGKLKSTAVRGPFSETSCAGPLGTDSPRRVRTERDFLGRTVAETRPGYGGSALVTSNRYDTAGRLAETFSVAVVGDAVTPLARTLYAYDSLGELTMTVSDRDFDGVVDWSGPDLIFSNMTHYVNLDGAWWKEVRQYSIREDGSAESRLVAASRTLVVDPAAQAARDSGDGRTLVSETVTIDVRGNETTNRTYRVRAAAAEVSWTKHPGSSVPAVEVATNGLVRSSTSRTGVTTTFGYDALGRRTSVADGRGNVTRTVYDAQGRVASTVDAAGFATTYGYDALGRQVSVTDPLMNTVATSYDAEGRIVSQRGATYPVDYAYDEFGEKVSMTTYRDINAAGDVTRWLRDEATGLVTNKVYADDSVAAYTYTPDGLLQCGTRPSGVWNENVYDAARQAVGLISSDGAQDAIIQRDRRGRVMAESNSVAHTEYCLDDSWCATNETQMVDSVSVSFEREFDAYGRLARFARVGGEESVFGYAPHGAISAVSNGNVAVGYAFTSDALDAGYVLAVQGGADFSREVFRHVYLRSCIVAVSNSCGNVSHGLEYGYDELRRPISRNADTFGYNARGEVVSATIDGRNERHSYDDIGNAVQASYPASTNDYTSNCRNQYSSIAAVSEGTQLVASVSYDLDGNMTRHGEWTYVYDSGNRLVSVASNGITVATMSYDTRGRRVKKVAADGTHRYFYGGWLLVYEHVVRPNNTTNEVEYVWGRDVSGTRDGAAGIGGLLYLKRDGAIYVPYYDAYGNILGYRDAQGNIVASYTYDAFGNIVGRSGAMADTFSFRFSTKSFDADCGLYYYGYRHYKPQIMCWLTEDPIGIDGGLNLYGFCHNNSLCGYDELGLEWVIERNSSKRWAIARKSSRKDTIRALADKLKLDFNERSKWLKRNKDNPCLFEVPNVFCVYTSKSGWGDGVITFVTQLKRKAMSDAALYQDKGFMVISHKWASSEDLFQDMWKQDGIYAISFAGHGSKYGFVADKDSGSAIDPLSVHPPYHLSAIRAYSCLSSNDIPGNSILPDGTIPAGSWKSHVSQRGTFFGYSGLVNWISQFWLEESINEE